MLLKSLLQSRSGLFVLCKLKENDIILMERL